MEPGDGSEGEEKAPPQGAGHSLSRKLLVLTVLFVMLAEVLIFVPSLANMRVRWLQDRLNTAAAAAVVIDEMDQMDLPQPVQDEALMATGTRAIVLRKDGVSRMLASADVPDTVDRQTDLAALMAPQAILDAFDTVLFGGNRIIRVFGPVGTTDTIIEVVMEEAPLRAAMFVYGRNVLLLSLVISFITAGLVFFAIDRIMIRPIRRMTANMQAFAHHPEDTERIIRPSGHSDEIGDAERHLSAMQGELQRTLKDQKNLADLGLAVSKINHDMRNLLASAQLMSDRLAMVDDPVVKRFAPKLLRTIDRAVAYSNEVLSYGKAREAAPKRRWLKLRRIVQDVRDLVNLDGRPNAQGDGRRQARAPVEFVIDMENDLEVEADSEQLFRIIHNLCRNAAEAMASPAMADEAIVRRLTVAARRHGGVVEIVVDDTGPGMPAKARENLFKAFRGAARAGGTGLGLAIARELVVAHGGDIELMEKEGPGTAFRIHLPDRPLAIDAFRDRRHAAGE